MTNIELIQNKYCLGMKSAVGDPNRKYEDRAFTGVVDTQGGLSLVVGAVADGVGSADFGANAAQIAIEIAVESLRRSSKTNILEIITDAFIDANKAVYQENAHSAGDGLTTLVISVIYDNRCYIGNVGDSRAYWVQASKKMLQLTMDHTYYNFYGGDPNSSEANILINAIGKKENVEVDLALYLSGAEDRKTAVKLGKAGLPLEPGDSILLCSDGLIKMSPENRPYAKSDELIDAITSEFGDNAAVKMVGYAEGRKVDDNVSAVVIQCLDKQRIHQMEATSQKHKQKALFTWAGIGLGIILLVVALIVVVSQWAQSRQELTEARNATAVVMYITNTPAPTLTPTLPIDPGKGRVEEVNDGKNAIYRFGNEQQQALLQGDYIKTGTQIESNDAMIKIVIGEQTGAPSTVYFYKQSQAVVDFSTKLTVRLLEGSVLLHPGSGRAEILMPNLGNVVARVQGSRMVVEIKGPDVWIYCIEGECDLKNPDKIDPFTIPVGQKRLYHSAAGTMEDPVPLTYDEKWSFNSTCNYCMADIIPTPTPTPDAKATQVCQYLRGLGTPCPRK